MCGAVQHSYGIIDVTLCNSCLYSLIGEPLFLTATIADECFIDILVGSIYSWQMSVCVLFDVSIIAHYLNCSVRNTKESLKFSV